MFEQLGKIKDAWTECEIILLVNPIEEANTIKEKVSFVIPANKLNLKTFRKIKRDASGPISVVLSYDLCKTLELPFIRSIYQAISSRYPLIDQFMKAEKSNDKITTSAYSISVDSIDTEFGSTDLDITTSITKIGEIVDQYYHHELLQKEFVKVFRKSFKIPGHVQILRSSLNLLKSRITIAELSLALCEISKYPLAAVICDMIDSRTGSYLNTQMAEKYAEKNRIPIIKTKTIIDLWRSILKIQKDQIATY